MWARDYPWGLTQREAESLVAETAARWKTAPSHQFVLVALACVAVGTACAATHAESVHSTTIAARVLMSAWPATIVRYRNLPASARKAGLPNLPWMATDPPRMIGASSFSAGARSSILRTRSSEQTAMPATADRRRSCGGLADPDRLADSRGYSPRFCGSVPPNYCGAVSPTHPSDRS